MSYRTTCPHCASVFRLDAGQLDAAQGWVQCSVCGGAFDARTSLLLEDGSPLPEVLSEPAVPALQETRPLTPEPAAAVPAVDAPHGVAQREAALDLPSIILIDPDIPLPDDPGPLPQMYPAATHPPAASIPIPHVAAAPPAARIEYAAAAPIAASPHDAPRRAAPWAWGAASLVLLLALLAQIAYFMRDTVVSQLPHTRPAFEQACAVLGCTLSLPKDLAQLLIVGSDLQTEARGRLTLTLTLGNRAGHAQAWPVLLLTLTDQDNRPLARRSFAPSEYLDDAERIAAGIPPRSEQPLALPLTVRDAAPAGFDLKLSY